MGKKKKRKGGKSWTRMAFKVIRIGALVAPAASVAIDTGLSGRQKLIHGVKYYTGFDMHDKRMDWGALATGYSPFLGASLATYGIPKLVGFLRKLF